MAIVLSGDRGNILDQYRDIARVRNAPTHEVEAIIDTGEIRAQAVTDVLELDVPDGEDVIIDGTVRMERVVLNGTNGKIHVRGINNATITGPVRGFALRLAADDMSIRDVAFKDIVGDPKNKTHGGATALGLGDHHNAFSKKPRVFSRAVVERCEFSGVGIGIHHCRVENVIVRDLFYQDGRTIIDNPNGDPTHGAIVFYDIGGGHLDVDRATILDAICPISVKNWGWVDGAVWEGQHMRGVGTAHFKNVFVLNCPVLFEMSDPGGKHDGPRHDLGKGVWENLILHNAQYGWTPRGGWPSHIDTNIPATKFRPGWAHRTHFKKTGGWEYINTRMGNITKGTGSKHATEIQAAESDVDFYEGSLRAQDNKWPTKPQIVTPIYPVPDGSGGQEPPTTPPQPPTTTPNPPGAATGTITVRLLATMDGQPLAMPDALASITVPATGAISESEQALLDIYRQLPATQRALVQNVASALLT